MLNNTQRVERMYPERRNQYRDRYRKKSSRGPYRGGKRSSGPREFNLLFYLIKLRCGYLKENHIDLRFRLRKNASWTNE
ncbi:MAG: hypothetical protein ACTSPU_13055 [Promethearchaeota archaeon]